MMTRIPAIAIAALLATGPALADDAHHPPGTTVTPVQAQAPQSQGQPGMPMGGSGMMGQGMGHGHGMGMGMGQGMMCPMMGQGGMGGPGMAAHIDGHVAFIKAELRITPQQENAWKPFEEALRASASAMSQTMGKPGTGTQSIGEALEQRQKQLAARLENAKRLQAAWSKLDPALSEDQRARAQQVLGPRLMMM